MANSTTHTDTGEACGACGSTFPTLTEVFSHPCPATRTAAPHGGYRPATTRADNVDAPDRTGNGRRRGSGSRPSRANRYPGPCVRCGQRVEAEQGLLVKDNSASRGAPWGVEHRPGHCPDTPTDAADGSPADQEPTLPPPGGRMATPKQVAYLVDLGIAEVLAGELTANQAAFLIDQILDTKPRDRTPEPEPVGKPNRFPGDCRHCGHPVEAGEGLVLEADGRWLVEHRAADCPTAEPLPDVPEGYYAVPSGGDNDLAFYRVDRPNEGRYAGRTFVRIVVGGQADHNLPRGQVAGILARIVEAGPAEAMARFGQEIGSCGACGRHLTDEESRLRGLGPWCARKMGAA